MSAVPIACRPRWIGRWIAINLILVIMISSAGCTSLSGTLPTDSQNSLDTSNLYYSTATTGSDSLYNPANAFFNYTFDTLQLSENFATQGYSQNLSDVWEFLMHPRRSIDNEGGFRRFVNREIFPIDSNHRRDSFAALPNYALHLLGDGMTYRRDLEWLRSRGYRYPRLAAVSLAMISEFLQEGLEAQNTTDADAIADLLIFRPLGLLLYSNPRAAKAIRKHLDPAIWPTLVSIDAKTGKLINTGMSYIYRPPALSKGKAQLFVHTGLNNMIGMSYRTDKHTSYTLAVGVAVEEIVRQRDIQAEIRPSMGMFKDRQGSLLWSAVINDVGRTRFRLNLFPGAMGRLNRLGVFFSLNDEWKVTAGINLNLPLGVGLSSVQQSDDCEEEDC